LSKEYHTANQKDYLLGELCVLSEQGEWAVRTLSFFCYALFSYKKDGQDHIDNADLKNVILYVLITAEGS
jgi:hypothetical protein